jgi:hypothetical protein
MRALLAPYFDRPSRRRESLGLDPATSARGVRVIAAVLEQEGPLTRAELGARLAAQGLPVAGQALIHLIAHAAWQGVLCQGADRAGEPAYAPAAAWLPPGPTLTPAEAAVALLRRYLAGYAPAGPADFAAWAGLPLGVARTAWAALAPELVAVTVAGAPAGLLAAQAAWLDEPAAPAPVRLLPAFDTYLLGYQNRDLALAPVHARAIHPGGGLIHPALLVDGVVAGSWRLHRRRDHLEVRVASFAPLPPSVAEALAPEAAAVGHFLGDPVTLVVQSSS